MMYIVRHGQTIWNLNRKKQGWKDSPLTVKGIKQAEEVAKLIRSEVKELEEYKIVISPLWRCRQFSSLLCEYAGLNYLDCLVEEGLKEHCYGMWEGLTELEIEDRFPGEMEKRRTPENHWTYSVPMGESYDLLNRRVIRVLEKYKNEKVIFVCHEMVSKVIRGHYGDLENLKTTKLKHAQNKVYKLFDGQIEELTTTQEN